MGEETASGGPEPPDIRPCRRINQENNRNKHNYTKQKSNHAGNTATKHLIDQQTINHSKPFISLQSIFNVIILILAITSIPTAFGQSLSIEDEYTSYPSRVSGSAGEGGFNSSKPLISSLIWLFNQLFNFIQYVTGYDILSGMSYHAKGLMKRTSTEIIVESVMIPVLVALSGVFAGLTLGYFSVDQTQLQVLSISGTPKQQEYARRIIPVRKDSHLLLTTLILANMIVNEALPEVANGPLGGGFQAVVVSTALVVIFAEIIPQSVCSRYGLLIGATMARPVRILIYVFFPLGWPVAKLLEYILGAHHGIIYRRSELRELIKFHAAGGEGGGDLDYDTVTMAQGALDLAQKTVREAMTPIDQVFMLPIDAKLDYETLGHVVKSGHSRVPVYQMVEVPDVNLSAPTLGPTKKKMVKKVLGSLLVKSCVLLDPEDATPLASIPINAIPSVPCDEPLTNMLNVFQDGRSHMAIVSRRPRRKEAAEDDAESVMTAAAGGLRQRFMRKVAEITHGDKSSSSESDDSDTGGDESSEGTAAKIKRKKSKKSKDKDSSDPEKQSPKRKRGRKGSHGSNKGKEGNGDAADGTPSKAEEVKAEAEAEKKKRSFGQAAKLTQLEQTVPADAQLPPDMVEKFFEGLEGAPLGIITLEDVLEELIGEEIYDEYDEHGGPRNAASAFIPREAAMAARQAALDREKALAAATPLPPTNDQDIEPTRPAPASQPSRRYVPKLPLPRFTRGRKPLSQPGKSRSIDEKPFAQANTGPPPSRRGSAEPSTTPEEGMSRPVSQGPEERVRLDGKEIPRSASPTEMDIGGTNILSARSKSDRGTRRTSGPKSTSVPGQAAPAAPLSGSEPVSAVPARLLPGTAAATTPGAPVPTNANLLSEALLLERGRRQLAAQAGKPAGPAQIRIPSAVGLNRSAVPSRTVTPPSAGAAAAAAVGAGAGSGSGGSPTLPTSAGPPINPMSGATAGIAGEKGTGTAGILSPIPVSGNARRGTKFKSVPTPISTPRIGTTEDPMEMTKIRKDSAPE